MGRFFKETVPENSDMKEVEEQKKKTDTSDKRGAEEDEKIYRHFDSPADQKFNAEKIENYDLKKMAVDDKARITMADTVNKYGEYMDAANVRRAYNEWSDTKIEIMNREEFDERAGNDPNAISMTIGYRTRPDGAIVLRDNDNYTQLSHTATHETMHDLSYQKVDISYDDEGHMVYSSGSGLREFTVIKGGAKDGSDLHADHNIGLNEGFTELYTLREMYDRGEEPPTDSYQVQVGLAMALEDKVGSDIIMEAYFGGNIDGLKNKINSMSDLDDAWSELNKNIDLYSVYYDIRALDRAYKIIGDLEETEQKVLVKRL